jgi:hypothetical protein
MAARSGASGVEHGLAVAAAIGRRAAGVLVGSGLGALLWLIILQEGVRHGWTDQNFNSDMGLLVQSPEGSPTQAGLRLTLLSGLVLGVLYVPLGELWVRQKWVRGLAYAIVPFLAWGLLFCPLVAGRIDGEPSAPFGADAGGATTVLAAAASLAFALVLARAYALMREPAWWRPRARPSIEETERLVDEGSLELAEERTEQPGVGP